MFVMLSQCDEVNSSLIVSECGSVGRMGSKRRIHNKTAFFSAAPVQSEELVQAVDGIMLKLNAGSHLNMQTMNLCLHLCPQTNTVWPQSCVIVTVI